MNTPGRKPPKGPVLSIRGRDDKQIKEDKKPSD